MLYPAAFEKAEANAKIWVLYGYGYEMHTGKTDVLEAGKVVPQIGL